MPTPPPFHRIRALFSQYLILRDIRFFAYLAAKVFCLGHLLSENTGKYTGTYGPSMLPTLAAQGDWVWISHYYRHGRGVKVGDVVNFKHPCVVGVEAGKRVVGMPGDFVMRDVYEPAEGKGREVMLQVRRISMCEWWEGFEANVGMLKKVPEGHFWVLGDNLTESRDSRTYGPLPLGLITGKIIAKNFPGQGTGFEWIVNGLKRPEAGT
ncbi:MAG: hypothetical protein Q9219_004246 [cf. Caloplaca sp. 3 TL-2023]